MVSPHIALIFMHPSAAAGHLSEYLTSDILISPRISGGICSFTNMNGLRNTCNNGLHPCWWLGLNEDIVNTAVSVDVAESGSAFVVGW